MASLYTLAELRENVYDRLEGNTVFWRTSEVDAIINEAIRSVNLITGFYQGALNLFSVANQLIYHTPVGMLYPQRVQFENSQLDPIPITRISQDYRTWATDTTVSTGGPVARWIPIGINYFALHPADSTGGGSIQVTGVLEPPLLVNPTDAMVMDDQWVELVVTYCQSRLVLKVSGPSTTAALSLYPKIIIPTLKAQTNLQGMKFPKFFILEGSPAAEGRTK